MKLRTLALAGALAVSPTLAVGQPPPAQGCLRNIDIWSFNALSDKTLIVENTRHQKYKLTLIGTCNGMQFKEKLAFKSIGGMQLSCLSRGDEVITHDIGMRNVCSITNIEPYTPAMDAADKAAKAAKEASH
jgi:hypothetical protein